ncbi:MAG: NAD-dependent deacetylase [Proteobacteria bacterium]|nr:NAD-dependent deacetylase [Pseudomonadota bacterium]MDA0862381.1 NAD-dependent deacetylase [Pseudomonadota bacterium]MDA1030531.1 NAD-dependent deacetylase [Pseudomonadota bacterium]
MISGKSHIERARAMIQEASNIVILTGAGVSTNSGIPDFRGPQGVWTKNPLAEKMSDIRFYMSDPEVRRLAWQSRLQHPALTAVPNVAHDAISAFEGTGKLTCLVTQNIDGLHQAAGNTPGKVIEIHGTIHYVVCMSCKKRTIMKDELTRVSGGESDPSCLECNGILKSDTISFGQSLDETKIAMAFDYVKNSDLLLCVGTTLQVFPIAGAVDVAKAASAKLIIVNNQATQYDDVADGVLRDSINEVIPLILGT